MDQLESMSVFVAVVQAGSFSEASRKLRMPLPTVSRKVAELEASAKSSDERAREIAARNGANLPPKDTKAGSIVGDGNTMTRADWNALNDPRAQADFFKRGGKLIESEPDRH